MSRPRRDALLVAAVAAGLRVLYWALYSRTPFFHTPVVDASFFDIWARTLAEGRVFQADVFFKPPLYPYLLSWLYGLFGRSLPAVYLLQSLAGVGTCLLTWAIGRRVFGPRLALAGGLVTAALPILPFFELQLLAESWTTLLTLLAAWLLLGVAALGRPNLLLAAAAVAGWLAWPAAGARRPACRPRSTTCATSARRCW